MLNGDSALIPTPTVPCWDAINAEEAICGGVAWPNGGIAPQTDGYLTDTARDPAVPSDGDAVWVTSRIGGASPISAVLTYLAESPIPVASTPFAETFGVTTVKPWTGTGGSDQGWTVTGSSYLSLDNSANYETSATECGLFYKGKTALNPLDSAMAATSSGINAAGGSGYVEFYIRTQTLEGTDGWAFQVDSGSGFVTRLSELTGSSHATQKYHYDLATSELVNGLQLRFQFTGGGVGDSDDRISVDQITVTVTTRPSPVQVALLDDGAHGDGAAADGVYGAQIPAMASGTRVSYYLSATDAQNTQFVDPAGAPGTQYSYTVVAAEPFAGNLVLGNPTASSIQVNVYAPDQDRDFYIVYGTSPDSYPQRTAPYSLAAGTPTLVTLAALTTDTQYYYRMYSKPAGTSDARYTSTAEFTFHTQRAAGSTFVFAIQGDSHPERVNSQFNAALYAQTLLAARADNPDFYLTIGDDFSADQLNYPTMTQAQVVERYTLQRPYLSLVGNSAPLFLVNGNHEQAARYLLDGTPDNVAVWAQNARNLYYPEPAPSPDNTFNSGFYTGNTEDVEFIEGDKLRDYFAWQWGDALFVAIDPYWSSPTCVDDPIDGSVKRSNLWDIEHGDAQYAWLKTTLEQSTAKYKFVFAHHVLGTNRGGADIADGYEWGGYNANGTWGFNANRPTWDLPIHPLMAANGVTAFIQGHDHIFVNQELDGVQYITLPEPADPKYYLYNSDAFGLNVQAKASNSGYARFTVAPNGVKVDYIREFLPADQVFGRTSGMVAASFTLAPAAGLPVITGRMPTPYAPRPTDPVSVTSLITDDGSVTGATLAYNAGAGTVSVTMSDDGRHGDGAAGDHVYGAQIPAQAAGTMVQYTITVLDNEGNQATSSMSYTVAPSISSTTATPSQPTSRDSVWLTSTVTDHVTLGRVTLTYQVGTATAVTATMYDDGAHGDGAAGDHVFGVQIPATADGTIVRYYVTALDGNGVNATDPATAASDKYTYTVSDQPGLTISGTQTVPSQPTPGDPAWVVSTVTGSPTAVQLQYNPGIENTVFLETFGPPPAGNVSPWTGGGVANAWTVTAASAANVALTTGANHDAVDADGGCGVRFLGGTTDPLQTMLATAAGIDARGLSATVQFYVKTTDLEGADGWLFQVDAGAGYVTRLSELTGSVHNWAAYTYTLDPNELVDGLTMRLQFQGGDADDQVRIDHLSLVVKPATVVFMTDDGAHGDGAYGDGVYGAQVPGLPLGTTVDYYVAATDGAGNITRDPAAAPSDFYSYTVGYPYDVVLGRPTNNSVAVSVMSRSAENLTCYVAYATEPGGSGHQTAAQIITAGSVATLAISSLQPNTQYYYRVYYRLAGGTEFKAGPEQTFHTQRAAGATFTFDVQADSHYGDPDTNSLAVYRAAAANIAADEADFLIDLGDTFMTEKYGVTSEAGIWAAVQAARANELSLVGDSTPLLLATGNHESELGWLIDSAQPTENPAVWATEAREACFPAPVPGDFYSGSTTIDPYVQEPRNSYYAFSWGDAQFLVLDPFWYTSSKPGVNDGGWGWTLGEAQYHWLQQTLAASPSPFKFVFIHHLVGGDYDGEARGGVEFSRFTEWGGYNQDGTWGFDAHRPGWAMPIQNLLLNYGVDVVFHGHDHLFVKQDLDANADGTTDLIYLECPQPASPMYDSTSAATAYGYVDYASDNAGNSGLQGGSGHIRVTVSATSATVEYVRAYATADQTSQQVNGAVSYSFSIPAPTLAVDVAAASVAEQAGAKATTVTISRNTDTIAALTVNLASSDASEATVPATVTIPAGQSSATVTLTAVDDVIVDGSQIVTITASAAGFASGSDTVQVADDDTSVLNILVGDWLIPAGETAWRIPVAVSGGVSVDGLNFNVQIEDGSRPVAEAGPVLTALDILHGTIFDGQNTGSWDNTVSDWIAWDWTEADPGETVFADGVIGYLALNTVGCPSGTWDLLMSDTLNGPTDFAGLAATIQDGTIRVNQRPLADAGGPYLVAEGGAVTLDGSDSLDPDPADSIVSYQWDLDGDGVFGETGAAASRGDETAVRPNFSAAGLDGPETWTVRLRVRDNNGLESAVDEVAIEITNVPPIIASAGASAVDEGAAYTLTLGAVSDPGSDTVSQWIVHWGDGSSDTYASGGDKSHVYADDNPTATPSDPYTITVNLTDDDGTHPATASQTITVQNVAPAVCIGEAPASSPKGTPLSLSADVTDPSTADTFTFTWAVTKDGSPYATGSTSSFTFTPDVAGSYQVTVRVADDDGGVDTDVRTINVTEGEVVGRHLFYNHSTFDGNDAGANSQDDLAIAPPPTVSGHGHSESLNEPEKELGKRALLPGETATFVNYTSYLLGINGIMVDIAHPANPGGLDAADFEFRVGNDQDPAGWQAAPAPAGIAVRPVDEDGDGAADFFRVTVVWEDYYTYNPDLPGSWKYEVNPRGIGNQWLQVRVLATEDTGIPADDVFYFGNAIGETGNSYGTANPNTFVNATDAVGVRYHPHNFLNPAGASDPYDFNRDGRVDASDAVIARYNPTNFLSALALLGLADEIAADMPGQVEFADAVDAVFAAAAT